MHIIHDTYYKTTEGFQIWLNPGLQVPDAPHCVWF